MDRKGHGLGLGGSWCGRGHQLSIKVPRRPTGCRAAKWGVHANIYRADTAREEATRRMVNALAEEFGRIDILVNNAAITRDKTFLKWAARSGTRCWT